jgi:CBS domain-containing protein
MRPAPDILLENTPLQEAFDKARETGLDVLPVVHARDEQKYVGLFEVQAVKRRISQEVLRRRQTADATA